MGSPSARRNKNWGQRHGQVPEQHHLHEPKGLELEAKEQKQRMREGTSRRPGAPTQALYDDPTAHSDERQGLHRGTRRQQPCASICRHFCLTACLYGAAAKGVKFASAIRDGCRLNFLRGTQHAETMDEHRQNQDADKEKKHSRLEKCRHGNHTVDIQHVHVKLQEASERQNRGEGFWPDHQHDFKNAKHLHPSDDLTDNDVESGHRILQFGPILRGTEIAQTKQNQC